MLCGHDKGTRKAILLFGKEKKDLWPLAGYGNIAIYRRDGGGIIGASVKYIKVYKGI